MIERDKRYEARFVALISEMTKAVHALEKSTGAAFDASEKAIQKAETAQKLYDSGHNDLIKKMETQHAMTMPRDEAVARFDRQDADLRVLREERSNQAGADSSASKSTSTLLTLISIGIALSGVVLGALIALFG